MTDKRRSYAGSAVFFLVVLGILGILIAYHINSIERFKEIKQVSASIDANASLGMQILDKYVGIYKNAFGNYPPATVLSVLIPLALIAFLTFMYYIVKFAATFSEKNNVIIPPESPHGANKTEDFESRKENL